MADKKQHGLWATIPQLFSDKEPAALVKQHRDPSQSSHLNQSLFLVVDRVEWEKEGLIVINLNFKGYVDAIRQQANVAGDDVPSMNIGNTTWFENLCNGTRPLFPRNMFAVYVQERRKASFTTRASEKELQDLTRLLQGGLDGRKLGSDQNGGVCVLELVEAQDMDKMKNHHAQLAKEKGYNSSIFAMVDNDAWDSHIILLVGVGGRKEGLRVHIAMVVELLQWSHVGLLSSDSESLERLIKEEGELLSCSGEPRN